MTQAVWSEEAVEDRQSIFDYIAEDNPSAAIVLDENLEKAVRQIEQFPGLGRTGRVADTREWSFHENYFVVYEWHQDIDTIGIYAVVHSRRSWPP